jgi:hypothetical protein
MLQSERYLKRPSQSARLPNPSLTSRSFHSSRGSGRPNPRRILFAEFCPLHIATLPKTLRCKEIRDQSKVFVLGEQKWYRVSSTPGLYLNDLLWDLPKQVLSRFKSATPGHLGTNPAERTRTADLIALPRLSSLFSIRVEPEGWLPLPGHWQANLNHIGAWMETELSGRADEEDSGDSSLPASKLQVPPLSWWSNLQVVVQENGAFLESSVASAARISQGVAVRGTPIDCAGELAGILIEEWKLDQRPRLIANLTAKLARLDQQEKIEGTPSDGMHFQTDSDALEAPEPNVPQAAEGVLFASGADGTGNANMGHGDQRQVPNPRQHEAGRPTWQGGSESGVQHRGPSWPKYGSGGESEEHRRLKEFVAKNPETLAKVLPGLVLVEMEHLFLSGDRVDILFEAPGNVPVAVEIEPSFGDLDVGAMQASKYRHLAAMEWHLDSCGEAIGVLVAPNIPLLDSERFERLGVRSVEVRTLPPQPHGQESAPD